MSLIFSLKEEMNQNEKAAEIVEEVPAVSINADEIYVFNTKDLFQRYRIDKNESGIYDNLDNSLGFENEFIKYQNPEQYQDYYFLRFDSFCDAYPNWMNIYRDVFNDEAIIEEHQCDENGDWVSYASVPWGSFYIQVNWYFQSINTFLQLNGFEDLQQSSYTEEDLLRISECIQGAEVVRRKEMK